MRISPLPIVLGIVVVAVGFVILLRYPGRSRTQSVRVSDLQPGPIQHPQLSADLEARIRRMEAVFAEVDPSSHEQWMDGFKRDLHPENEVLIWEGMATAYQNFTNRHALDLAARKEAFGLLLVRSSADEQTTLSKQKLQHLSPAQAEELVRLYSAKPQPIQVLKK